ncbi:Ldh family oxidoreductase [uncultured Piscinibacter sp.]|uniref:Ldh family oxidoreductase n=1 Tax=uncultured Piscinibacter sp. TaxID=1131835 RepID=UPI00260CE585|nr:Ldh family oxidoreductase [uncultured Piscinibacter sp.]
MSTDLARVGADPLRRWAIECLGHFDVPQDDARCLADSLVQTSLWGIDSHGIARLTHYLNRLAHGSVNARPQLVVTRSGAATAQVAGDRGLGIVVAHRANRVAMELARENGIGAVGVSDSSHCGAVGLYSRAAAREGLIGMAFTHSDKIAAPFGGHRPFLGTNPISLAFPREGSEPVCLDMATTSIPWNRVMNARREGAAIPSGVAVDQDGQDTTDAQTAHALRPLGGTDYGHKGYGLALIVELLCGPLHGNPFGPQIGPMYAELERPRRLGAFFVALDPMRFAGGPMFAATVEQMARTLAAEPGSPRMPGDPELAAEARRRIDGIPIEPGLAAEMRSWSARLGVASPL